MAFISNFQISKPDHLKKILKKKIKKIGKWNRYGRWWHHHVVLMSKMNLNLYTFHMFRVTIVTGLI